MSIMPRYLPWSTPEKKQNFQIMSDTHLEVGQQYETFEVPVCARNLVLAGDIGRLVDYAALLKFLQKQCDNFERVLLVLGNHEFYGISREEGLQKVAALEQEPILQGKLVVLNRKRVDVDDGLAGRVTILGCTLQSFITPEQRDKVAMSINDFKHIKGWTVDNHNREHATDLQWLKDTIKAIRFEPGGRERRILVITHHSPAKHEGSAPEHRNSPWGSAFQTNLLGNADHQTLSEVDYWVFGHTHYSTEFAIANVKVVANQRGYIFPNALPRAPTVKPTNSWIRLTSRQVKPVDFDVRKVIHV